MGESRKTFGPVVLLGLASAGLAAVAGTRPWVEGSSGTMNTSNPATAVTIDLGGVRESPLAGALALLVLACWGVVLVTRGRVRRGVATMAFTTAAAMLVTTVLAFWSRQDALTEALLAASAVDTAVVSVTAWYAAALVAGIGSALTTLAAIRYAPAWPEMGSRYDSPAGGRVTEVDPEDNLGLWKALDEGRDPTSSPRPLD